MNILLLIFEVWFQTYIAPILLVASVVISLILLYRRESILSWLPVLLPMFVVGLYFTVSTFQFQYSEHQAQINTYTKYIEEIQQGAFQIYRFTRVPSGYKIAFYSYTPIYEGGAYVTSEINTDGAHPLISLRQFPISDTVASSPCSENVEVGKLPNLYFNKCKLLATTKGGIQVYYNEGLNIDRILAIKANTGIYFDYRGTYGSFTQQGLRDMYSMIDSLQSVSTKELREYSKYFLDNLVIN